MTKMVKCPRRMYAPFETEHPKGWCALCNDLHGGAEISAALAGAYMLLIENGKHPDTETVKRLRKQFEKG